MQAIWPLTYMFLFLRRIQSRSVLKSLEETEELIMIIQILVVLVLIILCLVQGIKNKNKFQLTVQTTHEKESQN